MRLFLAAVLAAFLLAACASATPQPPREFGLTVTYGCANGSQVSARYSRDGQAMTLRVNGKTSTLTRVASADGAKYSNSLYTVWNRGDDIRLETASMLLSLICRDVSRGGASPMPTSPAR